MQRWGKDVTWSYWMFLVWQCLTIYVLYLEHPARFMESKRECVEESSDAIGSKQELGNVWYETSEYIRIWHWQQVATTVKKTYAHGVTTVPLRLSWVPSKLSTCQVNWDVLMAPPSEQNEAWAWVPQANDIDPLHAQSESENVFDIDSILCKGCGASLSVWLMKWLAIENSRRLFEHPWTSIQKKRGKSLSCAMGFNNMDEIKRSLGL